MNTQFNISDKAEVQLVRAADVGIKNGVEALFGFKGKFYIEHWRGGKKIGEQEIKNAATTVGLAHILNTQFASGTQVTTWFCGLVNNTPTFAVADTMASHSGWTESTAYSDGTRITWGTATTAVASMTNASAMVFNINGSATIAGIFITSNSTKGGTTGTLWATASFAAAVAVTNGDQLRVTYTLSAT